MSDQTKRKESEKLKRIKDYDRVRRFLRNIHLYGYFSREDYQKAGIASTGDYNTMVAMIREVLPEIEEAAIQRKRRKYPRIRRKYAHSGESELANSYLLYAVDEEKDIPAMLRLLSALKSQRLTLSEIAGEMELFCGGEETSQYSTARRRVLALMEYGAVEKHGKTFGLKKDVLDQLGARELLQLRNYVCFEGGVTYPRVPASFLLRTLDRELLRRGKEVKKETPILLRHSVNNSVFDEELVYNLLKAIRERTTVTLSLEQKGEKVLRKVECLPLALRVECRLGRWYLIGKERRMMIRRLSNIRKVELGEAVVEHSVLQEVVKEAQERYATTGVSSAMPYDEPVLVEAELLFGEFRGMRRQFVREMRLGSFVEEEGREYYRAMVNDPVECLPLLRAYSPWLRVLPGKHDLDNRLRDGLIRMRDDLKGGHSDESAQ